MRRSMLIGTVSMGLASLPGLGLLFRLKHRDTPAGEVTIKEVLALAERYATHEWTATEAHVFHGSDPDGIEVNTPDEHYLPADRKPGWWTTQGVNIGIPYKWGGFDLPEEFDAGLRAGLYAGDAYTGEKRRLLDDGVSRHSVGIDCSGFISRCWKLPRSYSTRELPSICKPVADWSLLRPGDIFNTPNAHVRLFAGWADDTRTRVVTYEASGRVVRFEYDLEELRADGYTAWRYPGLKPP